MRLVRKFAVQRSQRGAGFSQTPVVRAKYGALVAPKFITNMKYKSEYIVNVATSFSENIINMNSTQQQVVTGVGVAENYVHVPYGEDQFSILYNRYRVHRCSWRICFQRAQQLLTTDLVGVSIVVVPTNDVGAYSLTQLGFTTLSERPYAKNYYIGNDGALTFARGSMDLWKLNGVSKSQYLSDDKTQAVAGQLPTERFGLHIMVVDADGSPFNATGSQLIVEFELNLLCEWTDPKTVTGST